MSGIHNPTIVRCQYARQCILVVNPKLFLNLKAIAKPKNAVHLYTLFGSAGLFPGVTDCDKDFNIDISLQHLGEGYQFYAYEFHDQRRYRTSRRAMGCAQAISLKDLTSGSRVHLYIIVAQNLTLECLCVAAGEYERWTGEPHTESDSRVLESAWDSCVLGRSDVDVPRRRRALRIERILTNVSAPDCKSAHNLVCRPSVGQVPDFDVRNWEEKHHTSQAQLFRLLAADWVQVSNQDRQDNVFEFEGVVELDQSRGTISSGQCGKAWADAHQHQTSPPSPSVPFSVKRTRTDEQTLVHIQLVDWRDTQFAGDESGQHCFQAHSSQDANDPDCVIECTP
mmetsp:Transcript_11701/g.32585  ORF Transcript_11701/g.32585 Transcript_11701/m.32585 type:complete len:338 (+) Transcript_11701:609-1622(+)